MTHTLSSEGADASEDGTGRGTPIVSQVYSIMPMNSSKDYKARPVDVAQPLMTSPVGGNQGGDYVVEAVGFHMTQDPIGSDEQVPCIGGKSTGNGVIMTPLAIRGREGGAELEAGELVREGSIVRRLTPLECERLQGYPDGWTDNGQADSARYRQLGNSVAVPCVEWIARRLINVHDQQQEGGNSHA